MANIYSNDQILQKRNHIMMAAKDLYIQSNYIDITMAKIAQEAHVSKGTVFHYFASKEDLFMTILLEGYQVYFKNLIEDLKQYQEFTFSEFETYMQNVTKDLIINHQVLVRLNSLRGPILEGKANMQETIDSRNRLYKISEELSQLISEKINNLFTQHEIGHFFIIMSAIINGLMNLGSLNYFNHKLLDEKYLDFKVDLVNEAQEQMKFYLEGYLKKKDEDK